MVENQTTSRRKFIRKAAGATVFGTAAVGASGVVSALKRKVSVGTLGNQSSPARMHYKLWTTGTIQPNGSLESNDGVYNSGGTHYAHGEVKEGTAVDKYTFNGHVKKIVVYTITSDYNTYVRFDISGDLDYGGHDRLDFIGYNGGILDQNKWGVRGDNAVFSKPGDGSLESNDIIDKRYARGACYDGGHDHVNMKNEFERIDLLSAFGSTKIEMVRYMHSEW
ncbi:hypothetical protein V5735_22720 (plasmid) [Haladaptatus sp. SPP-AMP-3]|uniref:hypothetical protein n=1 Tax=Haladaptatus sp. SPP-AMP-3 TaxID=3121295 RepID=UPI003C2D0FD9